MPQLVRDPDTGTIVITLTGIEAMSLCTVAEFGKDTIQDNPDDFDDDDRAVAQFIAYDVHLAVYGY